ncbi:MAG: SPFH domain-containing protein [Lachnospiraceae bacterium]|nr:SPFH domain-containing protein [Lachnospiraceae bacterium]
MGLIQAGLGALGGTLADQWKEFFYCEAMDTNVLVTKGKKRINGRSSNTKGNDNIISNGSAVAVADGQCMIIVEQGKVVEVCAEPGEFIYDTSTEPSIFAGNLGASIIETFKTIGRRFGFGGDTGKDQRVYYFNTKELVDNKFGTANPVPFRIVDRNIKLDIDVSVRCSGIYSYTIADPILFYAKVCGNVESDYLRSQLDGQLKTEFVSALQPAFGRLSQLGLRPNEIVMHNTELEEAMNEALSEKWGKLRGLKVVSVAMQSVTLPEEDQELIKRLQRAAVLTDPGMAGGSIVGSLSDALPTAAGNPGGSVAGILGVGALTGVAGGTGTISSLYGAAATNPRPAAPAEGGWLCPKCGKTNYGKFCDECGTKKPEPQSGWVCPKCGKTNFGKFCDECGTKKPEAQPAAWVCPKCGKTNSGKFCDECGTGRP